MTTEAPRLWRNPDGASVGPAVAKAAQFLEDLLWRQGRCPPNEAYRLAADAGISKITLLRAKALLRIPRTRVRAHEWLSYRDLSTGSRVRFATGAWYWELPGDRGFEAPDDDGSIEEMEELEELEAASRLAEDKFFATGET